MHTHTHNSHILNMHVSKDVVMPMKITDHFIVYVCFGRDSNKTTYQNKIYLSSEEVQCNSMVMTIVINIFISKHFIIYLVVRRVFIFCLHFAPIHNTYCLCVCLDICRVSISLSLFFFILWFVLFSFFLLSSFQFLSIRLVGDYFCSDKYLLNNLYYYVNYCLWVVVSDLVFCVL